ncbi:hypothetical protein [Roseateles toxinivorans]|uniref:Uncharacterized protein n=1 Tax=Roseateles toxinivorans TaxID=270368 RepID=A0A4R6QJ37_9BURK|nr:hypothetical protein [Roseateles toxinivorans]TDP63540.1 hypothetical protein DES47_105548 [Roseateles toxinivorans]
MKAAKKRAAAVRGRTRPPVLTASATQLLWHHHRRALLFWGAALVLVLALAAWLARSAAPAADVEAPATPPAAAAAELPPAIPEATLEQLLAAPKSADWRIARLAGNTAVMVIEFPSLLAQGQAFNRAAALLEKTRGSRDRVLSDAELQALVAGAGDNVETFYQGHDYTGINIARFFTLAASQRVALNEQELRLRSLLLQEGVMREEGGAYSAFSRQAVIGFSAVQADNPATKQDETIDPVRRESVLLHELSHGQFFTRADYQKACWTFWKEALSDAERRLFRDYLARNDYDPGNEELMVNETQALLMHTPDARAFSAVTLGVSEAQLASFRARFRQVETAAQAAAAR